MSIIYLDNAATTQLNSSVLEQMLPYLKDLYGNPSSNHSLGLKARKAKEAAREKVASLIHAQPDEIFFTSGATESNNWIIRAVARRDEGLAAISNVEHASVMQPALTYMRGDYMQLKCDKSGSLHAWQVGDFFRYMSPSELTFMSCMLANNETGAVNDIAAITKIAHDNKCLIHTDATQGLGHINIDVKSWGVDALSGSAHKIHGPKGIGFLYVSRKSRLYEIVSEIRHSVGGHQESNLRAGTENVAGIVGLGAACAETKEFLKSGGEIDLVHYREILINELKRNADAIVNTGTKNRFIPILSVRFDGVNNHELAQLLDEDGVCVSTGSACNEGTDKGSHVLKAMGLSDKAISETIRLSIGRMNTEEEIDRAAKIICEKVKILRMFGE